MHKLDCNILCHVTYIPLMLALDRMRAHIYQIILIKPVSLIFSTDVANVKYGMHTGAVQQESNIATAMSVHKPSGTLISAWILSFADGEWKLTGGYGK